MWEWLKARRLPAIIILVGAAELGWMIVSSEQGGVRDCVESEKPYYLKEGRPFGIPECRLSWLERNREAIELSAAAITALFTIGLTVSTHRLWRSTKDLVESGDRQHLISNRAFVFVSELQYTELANGSLIVMIVFKNGGQTPTKNMTSNANAQVGPQDLLADHTYPGRAGADVSASIGPQAEVGVNQLIFTPGQFQELLSGPPYRLFIWGKATYWDVFEGTPVRETRFCYELVARQDGHGTHFMRFAQYGTYNQTT